MLDGEDTNEKAYPKYMIYCFIFYLETKKYNSFPTGLLIINLKDLSDVFSPLIFFMSHCLM